MTGIVERLLDWSEYDEGKIGDTREEAAAEIARLLREVEKLRSDIAYADKHASKVEGLLWGTAKENEKLRAALDEISNDNWFFIEDAKGIARAALRRSDD